jgi:NAD(P)H dehydrogenase (quinone)
MRVMIILAHPKQDSFNAALCRSLSEGLAEAGHSADVADLYAEGFDPRLGPEELDTMGSGTPAPAVAAYQHRVLQAKGLAFIFPVWWFGPPAILKGFVERVLQENFAFRFRGTGAVEGLLHHEKALVINTAGVSASLYRLFGFGKPLAKVFDKWTLQVCGIRRVRHVVFYDVVKTDDATRARYLAEARRLGRDFFSR